MRALVVDDLETSAKIAADELRQALDCDVVIARDPLEGIERLSEQDFDVAIIDMLFGPHTEEFEQRRRRRAVRLDDSTLHLSGLAVLHAIGSRERGPQPVIWTSGEPNRHLHLLFAYEELDARVFCSKEALGRLPDAVRHALAGEEYIDQRLTYYVPNRHGRKLRETILAQPTKLNIWRAIALGQHQHGAIARMVGVSAKTVRASMGEMQARIVELDPGLVTQNGPSSDVIRYASQNWEFFLDDTVRRALQCDG